MLKGSIIRIKKTSTTLWRRMKEKKRYHESVVQSLSGHSSARDTT